MASVWSISNFCVFQVYAVASEDMDSLTFGASRFLRHLMDPSSRKVPVMEFEISKVLWTVNSDAVAWCLLHSSDSDFFSDPGGAEP